MDGGGKESDQRCTVLKAGGGCGRGSWVLERETECQERDANI